MTRPSHILRSLAVLFALVLAAGGHAHARAPEREPAESLGTIQVPASVLAGDLVELRWAGVRGEVEEMELLLSLDGGATYPVRLTRELEGHSLRFLWRVPDLPTLRARLLLRVGGEGGERAGAVSREFGIRHTAGAAAPDLAYHEGRLWSGLRPATAAPCAAFGPVSAGYESGAAAPSAGAPVPLAPRIESAGAARVSPIVAKRLDRAAPCPDASAPREVPLRV
ncbi:MAG TPA: hypothetical protein VMS88_02615 [Terriglobales bacterium]|nr:hypothetical protein [Terriglobales bacterium]